MRGIAYNVVQPWMISKAGNRVIPGEPYLVDSPDEALWPHRVADRLAIHFEPSVIAAAPNAKDRDTVVAASRRWDGLGCVR